MNFGPRRWLAIMLLPTLVLASASSHSVSTQAQPMQCSISKGTATVSAHCCKICKKGKACGNTCIAREKICHRPPGCACDG